MATATAIEALGPDRLHADDSRHGGGFQAGRADFSWIAANKCRHIRQCAWPKPTQDVAVTPRRLVEWSTAEIMAKLDKFDAKHGDGADDDTDQIH